MLARDYNVEFYGLVSVYEEGLVRQNMLALEDLIYDFFSVLGYQSSIKELGVNLVERRIWGEVDFDYYVSKGIWVMSAVLRLEFEAKQDYFRYKVYERGNGGVVVEREGDSSLKLNFPMCLVEELKNNLEVWI